MLELSANRTSKRGVVLYVGKYHRYSVWFKLLINQLDLELIVADYISTDTSLLNIPISELTLVAFAIHEKTGVSLVRYITHMTETIRNIVPGVGVLCLNHDRHSTINTNLLPPRVWLITPDTTIQELTKYMLDSIDAKETLNHYLHLHKEIQQGQRANDNRTPPKVSYALPNFNIKHSGMLIPLAYLSLQYKTPVYVEISPQEALVYYNFSGNSCKDCVKKAFSQIRSDVDWVCSQTGAEILLHLDHCNDLELIKFTLDIGFNSIMADGAHFSLKSNIIFTQNAKKLADQYNIPTEGEIGAIDLHGLRKKSTTILTEALEFVNETDVDFLGVNARQYHSCDYGFNRARKAFLEYQDLKGRNDGFDLNLLEACIDIDTKIAQRGLKHDFDLRNFFKQIIDSLVFDYSYDNLLNSSQYTLSPNLDFWIKELKKNWNILNSKSIYLLDKTHSHILGKSVKHNSKAQKSLDFDLLQSLSQALYNRNTSLVLHGGSSIEEEDFYYLNTFDIARINIGSTPFLGYLNAIRSAKAGIYNYSNSDIPKDNQGIVAFLQDYGGNWKSWLDKTPPFLNNYLFELDNLFFKPLIHKNNSIS